MKNYILIVLAFSLTLSLNAQTKSPKRGVCFEGATIRQADIPALAPGMSWFYDWRLTSTSIGMAAADELDIEYCPMAWNAGWRESFLREYVEAHPNCKYILAYNEPNFKDQANMTPAEAAADWPRLRAIANELGLKIISPACNYSAWEEWNTPKKWLDAFFKLVPIEQVDGIALHCYMGWSDALIGYINEYIGYYNKPIWLTEFCSWDDRHGTPDASMQEIQKKYLIDTFDYLETEPMVARYAWFMAKTKENNSKPEFPWMQLLAGHNGTLTELGEIFNNMSSYDEDYYHTPDSRIEAEHYIRRSGIYMEETTDEDGVLDVYDFNRDDYLEYNLDIPEDGTYYFFFRYTSGQEPVLEIASPISGTFNVGLFYSGGQDTWATRKVAVPLKKGKQKIRMTLLDGSLRFNWFTISTNPAFLEETDPVEPPLGENLALGKPVFASSEQNHWQEGKLVAGNATDGNLETRWATEWEGSNADTENWFVVDLESNDAVIDRIIIHWEGAFATAYEILASADNENWETVYSTTAGKGGSEEISVDIQDKRYIKWRGIQKATQYGYSFYEFEIWGAEKTGIFPIKTAISVYPNPATDHILLGTTADIVLYDTNGKKLQEQRKTNSVDVSKYNPGIYFLSIRIGQGKIQTEKIIKK